MAGGFGIGLSSSRATPDFAAVVPHDGRSFKETDSDRDDLESGDIKKDSDISASEFEPVVPVDTPFFHIDLAAAVRAAENGARNGKS